MPDRSQSTPSATLRNTSTKPPCARRSFALPTAPGQPQVFLKLETLQPIGSFKIRGAYNAVRQLTPGELGKGVWTVSAGNAAQGVALAAQKLGARSSVLVMDTAPQTKLRAIRGFGATIVQAPFDECWRTVEEHRSDRMQGHFVHPFDDDHFISGNGTVGLEILEDLARRRRGRRTARRRRTPCRHRLCHAQRAARSEDLCR